MKPLIVVDPGHGGIDNGAVWGYAEEDDTNLSIAYLLRCELCYRGYKVELTRERDRWVSLSERVGIAKAARAALFVSIHCDAYHNTTVSGMSTHMYPKCSQRTRIIAKSVQTALMTSFSVHVDRGVKQSNFYVLRKTAMPAILIECEFLSNPETRRFLHEPENQLELARAISAGIVAAKGLE